MSSTGLEDSLMSTLAGEEFVTAFETDEQV